MKIVLDNIFTTKDLTTCSSHNRMQLIMKEFLSKRNDIFFYCTIPIDFDDKGMKWDINKDKLFKHPNVKYIPIRCKRDRMQEYVRILPELEELYSFQGDYWDADVYITARSTLVPILKQLSVGTRTGTGLSKKFIIVDGFPQFSFKGSAGARIDPLLSDLIALTGYQAADNIYVMSPFEVTKILESAKGQLSPANTHKIKNKLNVAVAFPFEKAILKTDKTLQLIANRKKPFTIAYTRRFNVSKGNTDEVLKAMSKNWIYRGKSKVRCVFTSATDSIYNGINPDWMEMVHTPREEFWNNAHENFDVMINLSLDEGFALSLLEPLSMGVPGAIINKPWIRDTLGPEYPFYVKNAVEAYTVIKCFHDDYPKYYKLFSEWVENHWNKIIEKFKDMKLPDMVINSIEDHEQFMLDRGVQYGKNKLYQEVAKYSAKKNEIHIEKVIVELVKKKVVDIDILGISRITRRVSWGFTHVLNDVRLGLMYGDGAKWTDASSALGHMKRIK